MVCIVISSCILVGRNVHSADGSGLTVDRPVCPSSVSSIEMSTMRSSRRAREHFRGSTWLVNVVSESNFTPLRDFLIGRQFRLAMESAWFARHLGRGWVSPRFIHQQRNNTLVEEMIHNGSAKWDQHPHIMNTKAVPCESLFDCRREVFESYIASFMTLEQLYVESGGVIDHLLVQEPEIIGGQACTVPQSHPEVSLPRTMEFYGLTFRVNRISCFLNESRSNPLAGNMAHAIKEEDKVVAIAFSSTNNNPQIPARDLIASLRASLPAKDLMQSFHEQHLTTNHTSESRHPISSSPYLATHWRRGDRGHPEMGNHGQVYWRISHPANMACLINRMVAESKVNRVFVMTNSGCDADRRALRLLVQRGSGARVVFLRDFVADGNTMASHGRTHGRADARTLARAHIYIHTLMYTYMHACIRFCSWKCNERRSWQAAERR